MNDLVPNVDRLKHVFQLDPTLSRNREVCRSRSATQYVAGGRVQRPGERSCVSSARNACSRCFRSSACLLAHRDFGLRCREIALRHRCRLGTFSVEQQAQFGAHCIVQFGDLIQVLAQPFPERLTRGQCALGELGSSMRKGSDCGLGPLASSRRLYERITPRNKEVIAISVYRTVLR
jgi:hypothetical protein